jgi:hypothetical protein
MDEKNREDVKIIIITSRITSEDEWNRRNGLGGKARDLRDISIC